MLLLAPSVLAAGDANVEGCPNEALSGFREYLPDCRAYEMVSPVFKDGSKLSAALISASGMGLLGSSNGVSIGGSQNGGGNQGVFYQLSRSGPEWAALAITPPASLFPTQEFLAASPNLGQTLWLLRTPAQSFFTEDLYVREGDGSLGMVGPLIPPAAAAGDPAGEFGQFAFRGRVDYADASADLSHVLFKIKAGGPLWPGDTTDTEKDTWSLYEYTDVNQHAPELVGVDAEGRLLSDCETSLGSQGGRDIYNAMSTGGATVFFTAVGHSAGTGICPTSAEAPEVSELYARLDRVESVPISEPSAQECAACETPASEALGRRPAEFTGASEDGSKVFFLTEQELLPEATGMNLYEYDFDNPRSNQGTGRIVRVSAGSTEPEMQGVARVSEDGSHVYFVAEGVLTEGPNAGGREPIEGEDNLYVFERDATHPAGHVAFIATLCSGEEKSGSISGVNQCPAAGPSEGDSRDWSMGLGDARPVQTTPEGRFLVFQSMADLTPGDKGEEPQIFEYDAATEELVRVSAGRPGYEEEASTHASSIPTQFYVESGSPATAATSLAVSGNGSTVVFNSAGALTQEAEDAAEAHSESVYEYRSAGSIGDGNVYLVSDGANALGAHAVGLDPSGQDVFFETADPLVPQDTDTQFDIYDARVDGGSPAPVSPLGCEGEACQGSPLAQPSFLVAGSVTESAGGNVPPASLSSSPSSAPTPRKREIASQIRATKLARALKACGRKARKRRLACESRARRRYGSGTKATTRRSK